MKLQRRVWFRGIPLDELDESVVIRSVDTGVPHETINSVNLMGGFGQRITSQHWETLDCSVSFAINKPKYDLAGRRAVFDEVITWATGTGQLQTSERPDKKLWVDKVVIPGAGDLWDWTREYTIVFRAYSVPFWQDTTETSVGELLNDGTGEVTLNVNGNAQTVLNLNVQNLSGGEINAFSVTAGGNTISLSGIELANNGYMYISHGSDGLLKITKGSISGTSVYDKRSADSADDLYINPGENTVSVEADGKIDLVCYTYGRYL